MPASYAHYRFGKQVLEALPPDARQCIHRFRRMYEMGLHGPDILFYYYPLMKNSVRSLCEEYHARSGREFFSQACARADSEAGRAYLYGLLAHYCLDASCRSLAQQKAASEGVSHAAVEAEFDRYLMAEDGIPEPHTQDLGTRLKLTRGECMTVASFYPPATGGNISACVRGLRWICKLGVKPERQRARKLLQKLNPGLADHWIPETADAGSVRTNSELLVRYNRAAKQYPALLAQLQAHMRGEAPLGEDFSPIFG